MYVRKYTKHQVHPRFHQSASAKARYRTPARKEVALQYKAIISYVQTKLYGLRKLNFFRHLSFHSCYTLGVFLAGLFGALLLTQTDGFFFVDAFLLANSAFCEAGLSTVSMLVISHDSFIVLATLVFFGNAIMMLIYPLLARTYYFQKVLTNITAVDKAVLDEYRLWHEGTVVFMCVLVCYIVFSILVGILVLYFALQLHPIEPEMQQRGFSALTIAAFHSLSAFANAGFALSSSQMEYYGDNPLFYTTLSVLILLGNTASPIALRWCMTALHSFLHAVRHHCTLPGRYINIHAVKYVLDNPRRITTNLFSKKETNFLGYVLVAINLVQYVLYLASTLERKEALAEDGPLRLAAIGTFQTIVTRTAGFQIVNLRTVNQGMLVVYALAMYLSAAPFLTTMYLTEDNVEQVSQLSTIDCDDSSDDSDDDVDDRFRPPMLKRAETQSIAMNIKNNFMTKHIYYLLFAVVLLAFSEDAILSNRPEDVNLWYILFEVASAYGTVGLSLGLPGRSYSLVGAFSPVGKLIITCVIFLGKHRGLPLPTDAVIDFKFNRLKRASRRKAKASLKVDEKPKSMIQNVISSVQQRVESISPRVPKKVQSKGIAIIELKPREKRKGSMKNINAQALDNLVNDPNSPAPPSLQRVGSYHDVNPNLPLQRRDTASRELVPGMGGVGAGGSPMRKASRRRHSLTLGERNPSGESTNGITGLSPVDKILSHIGVMSPKGGDSQVRPFVYSPRSTRKKSEINMDRGAPSTDAISRHTSTNGPIEEGSALDDSDTYVKSPARKVPDRIDTAMESINGTAELKLHSFETPQHSAKGSVKLPALSIPPSGSPAERKPQESYEV